MKNAELVRRTRAAYLALQRERPRNAVRLVHVRSHTRDPGNETADFLAKLGADTDDLSNVYSDDELLTLANAEYKRVADGARRPSLATLRTPYPTPAHYTSSPARAPSASQPTHTAHATPHTPLDMG